MARKLLSLLCAVALLVSMVTIVATVTATAEGTTTNFLDATNTDKWTVDWGFEFSQGPFGGAVNLTKVDGFTTDYAADDDIQGVLWLFKTNNKTDHDGSAYVTFTYGESVTLGNDFSLAMTLYDTAAIWNTTAYAVDNTGVSVKFGDYTFKQARLLKDVASAQDVSGARCALRFQIFKGDSLIAESDVIAKDSYATFNGKDILTRYDNVFGATASDYRTYLANNCLASGGNHPGANQTVKGASINNVNDFAVTVKDGKMSVTCNGTALTFGDKTELDVNGSFDGVPFVKAEHETVTKNEAAGVLRLSATVNETASSGETSSQAASQETSSETTSQTVSQETSSETASQETSSQTSSETASESTSSEEAEQGISFTEPATRKWFDAGYTLDDGENGNKCNVVDGTDYGFDKVVMFSRAGVSM
ncbi:MAG: hypothetical protein J6X61_05130, partial [Clostridia bacterium]|nr:hypothetical protein [Clostridia bacterium]